MVEGFLGENTEATREQLIQELAQLRQRVAQLEAAQTPLTSSKIAHKSNRWGQLDAKNWERAQSWAAEYLAEGQPCQIVPEQIIGALESVNEAFACIDRDWRCTYINVQAEQALGKPRTELIGQNIWEVFPELTNSQTHELAHRAMAEQVPIAYETFFAPTRCWFSVRLYPSPQNLLIYFVDMTERRQTEEALQGALQKLTFHVENTPLAIVEWNRNLEITRWSSRAEEMFGWKADEILGQQLYNLPLIYPDDRQRVESFFAQLVTGQSHRSIIRSRNLNKTHAIVYCEWYMSALFDETGTLESILSLVLDVTDRQRAEDAVRVAHRKAFSILETITEGFAALDEQWRFTYINPQGERILGLKQQEVMGCSIWELFPSTTDLRLHEEFNRVAREETSAHFQEYNPNLDTWLEYHAYPLRERGICLYFQDISDRIQMEQTLKVNRQRLDLVLRASDLGVWFCDLPFDKLEWNDKCKDHFGWPADAEITIDMFYERLHTDDREGVRRAVTRAIQDHSPFDIVYRTVSATGRERWIHATGSAFYDENDQPIRFDGITVDVTEQKRQEEERDRLLHREQVARYLAELNMRRISQLQELTAALAQALTKSEVTQILLNQVLSALNAERGWVAQCRTDNAGIIEIVGVLGYADVDVSPYRQISIADRLPAADAIRSGQLVIVSSPQEYQERYPELADLFVTTGTQSLVAIPLTIEKRVIGALGLSFSSAQGFSAADRAFMQTLAQQCAQALERSRLYEAERLAREVAEAANRVKDEFLAVLSHELRSPLNPILGWSRLLQSRQFEPQTTRRALQTIERNAQLQTQLIGDLLDVSCILQGNLTLNITVVDLLKTIEAALETTRLAVETKAIDLRYVVYEGGQTFERRAFADVNDAAADAISDLSHLCGFQVTGDSARLQQIVWNLLSNAIKFTPYGGRVELRLERVLAANAEEGMRVERSKLRQADPLPEPLSASSIAYARITVTDTGKGIAPDFLPYVFDYFRQADSTTTRRFGGLGLGLAIVRNLVELHGGSVRAESPGEGQGATFVVLLPLSKPHLNGTTDSGCATLAPGEAQPLQNVSVLVVDDESDMRDFAQFVLEQAGARVVLATSALDALQMLPQAQPDILLTDIGMPDMDGYMLLQQIRKQFAQGKQIPAIALTAYAGEYNQQRTLAAGFNVHLAKPVDPDALVSTIHRLVFAQSQ